ncbi:MAG: F420H2 dehydrogenase subunit FpoO [Halobacteria archaeon]
MTSPMADCDLCGRAEVTLVPLLVPSDLSAHRESGTWAGLCTRCVEMARSGSGGEVLAGRCALCRRRVAERGAGGPRSRPGGTAAGLSPVTLERPSLSGPRSFTAPLCPECVGACRSSGTPAPAPAH